MWIEAKAKILVSHVENVSEKFWFQDKLEGQVSLFEGWFSSICVRKRFGHQYKDGQYAEPVQS
jgi:hypothetical protein